MQALIPRPDLAPTLQAEFVALAADIDAGEPSIEHLLDQLGPVSLLPIVLVARPDGRLLAGKQGTQSAEGLRELLADALARRAD